MAQIVLSADELYNGAVKLNLTVRKLEDGVAFYKNGIHELKSRTSSMNAEIENKINEIIVYRVALIRWYRLYQKKY